MKLILFAALIVSVSPVTNAQKEKGESMKWRSGAVEGYLIPDDEYTSTRKGAILYCLSNDEKDIYVDMKITESEDQSRILQSGMTIWLNADGKSRKTLGIRFPVGSRYTRDRAQNSFINKPTPLSMANTIQLVGFGEGLESRFPSENTDNIRGVIKYDEQGNLIYNMTIPVDKLPEAEKMAATDPKNLWTIGIEYGAPPVMTGQPPSGARPPSGAGASIPRGGGGRGGGGGMPPGGGMPGGSMQGAAQPVLIWARNMRVAVK
jgi:hypothetical protein